MGVGAGVAVGEGVAVGTGVGVGVAVGMGVGVGVGVGMGVGVAVGLSASSAGWAGIATPIPAFVCRMGTVGNGVGGGVLVGSGRAAAMSGPPPCPELSCCVCCQGGVPPDCTYDMASVIRRPRAAANAKTPRTVPTFVLSPEVLLSGGRGAGGGASGGAGLAEPGGEGRAGLAELGGEGRGGLTGGSRHCRASSQRTQVHARGWFLYQLRRSAIFVLSSKWLCCCGARLP